MRSVWLILVSVILLAGCATINPTELPDSVPTEFIPTFIVETLSSRRQTETLVVPTKTSTPTPTQTLPATPDSSAEPLVVSTLPVVTPTDILPASTVETLEPVLSPTPSPTAPPTRRPTLTPTITPTPRIPNAAIQIQSPGPGSKIMSPLKLRGWMRTGKDGKVRIELLGEDGRLLARKINSYAARDQFIYIETELDFEIPGVAEASRLVISTYDTYGRLSSLSSRELILLSVGEEEINPPAEFSEPAVFTEPPVNKLIQGGNLLVIGSMRSFNDKFILVDLVAPDGTQVGYRQFVVIPDPAGGYVNFSVEVPYKVSKLTPVLLTIKVYSDGRISGMIYVVSREIVLSP